MAVGEAELEIERLSHLGEGVGRHDGRAVFVPDTAVGDRVRVRIREQGRALRAELLAILKPGPTRRAPPCSLAGRCGGCDWLHLDEDAQREAREEALRAALIRFGGLDPVDLPAISTRPSPHALGYRRRAVLHRGRDGGYGLHVRGTHDVSSLESCVALTPPLEERLPRLKEAFAAASLKPAGVTLLEEAGRVAMALDGGRRPTGVEGRLERVRAALGLEGVSFRPTDGQAIEVGRVALPAQAPLADGVTLWLRPDGFVQANGAANAGLVREAVTPLAPRADERVLELYAGHGNFSFALAERCHELWAVEGSHAAVTSARRSAADVKNLRLFEGEVAKVVEGLIADGARFDAVLLDPPREGAPGLERWLPALGVGRVTYVSCDPASLARDVGRLTAAGYRLASLRAVEMFPQTRHAETVATLVRAA